MVSKRVALQTICEHWLKNSNSQILDIKRIDMKILVTGAKGFVGKNLCAQLNNIKEGKDKTHPNLSIESV